MSGNNGSLGNRTFRYKCDLPEKGYKDSRLFLNKYLANLDSWGISELEQRFTVLADRFIEIWPYPDVVLEQEIDFEEVNIFDADDPTGRKLDYAIFLDQKLQSRQVSDLFLHVFSSLFALEPERFFVTDLAERIQLSKDSAIHRSSKPISDIYFIETHLNNREKFERLTYALTTFELEDDLFIKYAN